MFRYLDNLIGLMGFEKNRYEPFKVLRDKTNIDRRYVLVNLLFIIVVCSITFSFTHTSLEFGVEKIKALIGWIIYYMVWECVQIGIFLTYTTLIYVVSTKGRTLHTVTLINSLLYIYPLGKILQIIGYSFRYEQFVRWYPFVIGYVVYLFINLIYHLTWEEFKVKHYVIYLISLLATSFVVYEYTTSFKVLNFLFKLSAYQY